MDSSASALGDQRTQSYHAGLSVRHSSQPAEMEAEKIPDRCANTGKFYLLKSVGKTLGFIWETSKNVTNFSERKS